MLSLCLLFRLLFIVRIKPTSTDKRTTKMKIGYARVSTDDQNLDLQRDALTVAGCERLFTDTASRAKAERPIGFNAADDD